MEMREQLTDVRRCPHCSIASPFLYKVWSSKDAEGTPRTDNRERKAWAVYLCRTCGGAVSAEAYGRYLNHAASRIYPTEKQAHEDIPEIARTFLQQAYDTLHAPDAAAVMAGSAVDAMLKDKGYEKGSLYDRIDKALADNVLTHGMAEWAHSVRLGSNRPRHADAERPHVSHEEARQSVEFAEALGNFLFVLTARIERGIQAAKAAEG
ncbi:DUF4145 domain-containing protein [Sinorhizobium meliloti]|uniref:DUF4145 domain-containing protein n=1 Tax=Rhizobium meliloti TaxID=382 RepID=UPI0018DA9C6C|nr:DUF4145 domain-containing protein [Sinorhizobium meliloti]MDW9787717.1 DUF4145 domain-containing protein [Sinorhizobium meliloti]MDX0056089.1 DUF4145 domain-containing protein [Sinorhizobium meliloti]QPI24422.1 DUF4145 domain-containing protein [Sinorhizobium meliloti]